MDPHPSSPQTPPFCPVYPTSLPYYPLLLPRPSSTTPVLFLRTWLPTHGDSFLLLLLRVVAVAVRQGFSVLTALNVLQLCISGWPQTQKSTSAGIKGVRHHTWLTKFYPMTTYPYHPSKWVTICTLSSHWKQGFSNHSWLEQRRTWKPWLLIHLPPKSSTWVYFTESKEVVNSWDELTGEWMCLHTLYFIQYKQHKTAFLLEIIVHNYLLYIDNQHSGNLKMISRK